MSYIAVAFFEERYCSVVGDGTLCCTDTVQYRSTLCYCAVLYYTTTHQCVQVVY